MGISTQGGGLVNGAVNQGRGVCSKALFTKGGEIVRRCCSPKEGSLLEGAVHQRRGDRSTVLFTKGGETGQWGYPPREEDW